MATPSFVNLWSNYPTDNSPCDGPWANQCAIRMSITLNAEGSITVVPVLTQSQNVPTATHAVRNRLRIGSGETISAGQQFTLTLPPEKLR